MSTHLRLVGPDERAPRLVHRLYEAAAPVRAAAGGALLRAGGRLAGESLAGTGWNEHGRPVARVVAVGISQAAIRATIRAMADELASQIPGPSA